MWKVDCDVVNVVKVTQVAYEIKEIEETRGAGVACAVGICNQPQL